MGLLASTAQAGKITSIKSDSGAEGFGGWNLNNVTVNVPGGSYDESDGAYTIGPDDDGAYTSSVEDDEFGTTVMSTIIAKPWPVGEPPGIKVINDDLAVNPKKPINCIISTSYLEGFYLDTTDLAGPQQVICSSGFQTHKRYKQALLPNTVTTGNQGTDMVFNVETEAGSRDYQVFQKINNWTDSRLEGFTIQVGFGVGAAFVPVSDLANLGLSVPKAVWREDQLATFSHGLFGAPDKHFPNPGYFDNTSAGYFINEYKDDTVTGSLTATTMLPGNYSDVPPGGESASNQFGPWLPNIWLPQGIFFDNDGNPDTDAELVAWYGCNPALPEVEGACALGWMTGQSDDFKQINDEEIKGWAEELAYSMGEIDDLVNVGLNYIVTVGGISGFPGYDVNPELNAATFTIRITPTKDTSNAGQPADQPGFVGKTPDPMLTFTSSTGEITLSPSPEFLIGDSLTVRVGDADINENPELAETLLVEVISVDDSVPPTITTQTIILTEEGVDRGVFVAGLPAEFSNVVEDTVVTVTYTDADDGMGGIDVPVSATSTAKIEDTIVESFLTIDQLTVPVTIKGGATRTVKVKISLDVQGLTTEEGFLTVKAIDDDPDNNDIVFEAGFMLDPKQSMKYSFDWTAPDTAQTVVWEASVVLDSGGYVAPVTETTEVKENQSNKP